MPTWGQWIKQQREALRLPLSEAAHRLGWKVQQLSRMEADEPRRKDGSPPMPSLKTVRKFAALFDLPLSVVREAAGYRPLPDGNEETGLGDKSEGLHAQILRIIKSFPPEDREAVLDLFLTQARMYRSLIRRRSRQPELTPEESYPNAPASAEPTAPAEDRR
ncbi:MAG TPA: helix-turn-helix transcriptional regulator [Chthonomonadaceae bacterium]|nr:helix-turn-helix transcriptional regulator [Chthonomonadaceae bacterium]